MTSCLVFVVVEDIAVQADNTKAVCQAARLARSIVAAVHMSY